MTGSVVGPRTNDQEVPVLTESDLRHRLTEALDRAGIGSADVRIRADPFGGWRVLVVSQELAGLSDAERRRIVPAGIDEHIALAVFRTPEEGVDEALVLDQNMDVVPLWPESLARGAVGERVEVRFPADVEASLDPPVVVTFYSLRGGVGRSTALAYAARILAREHRVLCVDMDLEAPGLAALFGVEEALTDGQGVVPLLVNIDLGAEPDITEHLVRVDRDAELYLLPAGLPTPNYARQLAQIDPAAYYREDFNPLRALMSRIRSLRLSFDVILLDARTGISPLSAPLLFDLADLAVVAFFPHPQSFRGTRALVRALLHASTERSAGGSHLTPAPSFLVSPVPSGDQESIERYEERALEQINSWVDGSVLPTGASAFDDAKIADITNFIVYNEAVATSDSVVESADLSRPYEPLAEWISGYLPSNVSPLPDVFFSGRSSGRDTVSIAFSEPKSEKELALDELSFSTVVAEQEDDEELRIFFLRTSATGRALSPDIPLVIGRKGTGKTMIFRKLSAPDTSNVTVVAPSGLGAAWLPGVDEFALLDSVRAELGLEWRAVWQALTALAVAKATPDVQPPAWAPTLGLLRPGSPQTGSSLVEDLRALLAAPDVGPRSWEWIRALDEAARPGTLLLFDGLDSGFGGTPAALFRRAEAITGLLELVNTRGDGLVNLRYKILLREDLYRAVNIPNKSHFFGREVRLSWADPTEYLKVGVKRAVRAPAFRRLLNATVTNDHLPLLDVAVEVWSEDLTRMAWRLLAGERVAGSKTAFTWNWVWKRLADANDDHSPRALLQLLGLARDRERTLNIQTGHPRSVIRPKAMIDSLGDVSEQALISLQEEFPELKSLLDELRSLPLTPFAASDIRAPEDIRRLAQEVGLLGVSMGTPEQPERFRVPELYRLALNMGRKGQR
ncbi:P-loop ATPase, Sll1717 family [Candidatus Protofrankia californiensis]|uniref:P-loop ATPase, Sll1717 family n=1 Tax=Candidatus Protofrankia californiensis TaxID=1839754 RepID=UPI0010414490|nr:AAA family ATPase [Candidatus Protofrankia californiensis]